MGVLEWPRKAALTYEDSKSLILRRMRAGVSLRNLASDLEEGKYPTARGSFSWCPSSIQSVVRSAGK